MKIFTRYDLGIYNEECQTGIWRILAILGEGAPSFRFLIFQPENAIRLP